MPDKPLKVFNRGPDLRVSDEIARTPRVTWYCIFMSEHAGENTNKAQKGSSQQGLILQNISHRHRHSRDFFSTANSIENCVHKLP